MTKKLIEHIQSILDTSIISVNSLSGGDTASISKLITAEQSYYILKYGEAHKAQPVLIAESKGLRSIAKTNTIATPKIIDVGTANNTAYLLMDYISPKSPSSEDYHRLGTQLSELHKIEHNYFGLESDNFIGSLEQKNGYSDNWIDFYIEKRLGIQFNLALQKKVLDPSEIPSASDLRSTLSSFCTNAKPSLLHGDLWSGNFLISEDGTPYLIDPAVYYGHSEIDIAMSKLFGGFHPSFYEAYYNHTELTDFQTERIDLYQLYYLLVHLNIFGSSYYRSVKRILNSYF